MENLVLIDGNSLLNRAFYATPVFTTKDGLPTNAVFGFVKLILKIISERKPSHFAVAFDLHAPTFRHKLYKEYKAGRKPMPSELAVQVQLIKEVLQAMNICTCELEGYEADDIIGTLAKRFPIQTYIYTGDRDSYQLVDDSTTVCYTRKGVSDLLELSAGNFQAEIGLTPSQIIDLKALMGDKSDNIPGVPGVGEKSARTLLEKYSNLNGVYEHLSEISGALHTKLEQNEENARFSYALATIDVNVPLTLQLDECKLEKPFPYKTKEKFAKLEFKSLLSMNIYAEENGVSSIDDGEQKDEKVVKETRHILVETTEKLAELITLLGSDVGDEIAYHATENEVAVCLFDKGNLCDFVEYKLPFTTGLLSPGFFDYQLAPLYRSIFEGKRKVIAYNTKELRKRLLELGVEFTADFEDVSILKCLSEGTVNADDLEFCLEYYSLPTQLKAKGVYDVCKEYLSQLTEEEVKLYRDVELPLSIVLFEMERVGVCVDRDYLHVLSSKYKKELADLTEQIYLLAGESFNVNSTQQLGKILFEKLRIGNGQVKKKSTNFYKTGSSELLKFVNEHEIISLILRYRKIQKLNSTYLEGIKPFIKSNGRIYTTFNQINTSTGRLSSSNPNLQSIPVRNDEGKELRKLFLASEGNLLIDADYSQIELRLLADFSGCKELISAFNNEEDIHALTASQVFNVNVQNVTSDMRRQAKAVNFGIIYGISAFGLAEDLGISPTSAQKYINKYFETYSSVKEYFEKSVGAAKLSGYTKTYLGRKRVINELNSSNRNVRLFGERAAMNMPLQGSSADIIKLAMINVYKKLKEGGFRAKLIMQVHDELIIDCPKDEVEKVAKLLKDEMEGAVRLSIPLSVDVGIGKNWLEAK